MCDSVRSATLRGTVFGVHCAADEYLMHGVSIPLDNFSLTVHPIQPGKPFAKVLDRADLLVPIVSDMLCRVMLHANCAEESAKVDMPLSSIN